MPSYTQQKDRIGGRYANLSVVPVISTSIYAEADAVGALNSLIIPSDYRNSQNSELSGVITSLQLASIDNVTADQKEIFLFKANPSASTFTDNAALVIAAADLDKCIGQVTLVAADHVLVGGGRVLGVKQGLNIPFNLGDALTLYAAIITRGTPTYTTTSSLKLGLGIWLD